MSTTVEACGVAVGTLGASTHTCAINRKLSFVSARRRLASSKLRSSTNLSTKLFTAAGVLTSTPRVAVTNSNLLTSSFSAGTPPAFVRPNEKVYTRLRRMEAKGSHNARRDCNNSGLGTTCARDLRWTRNM